MTRKRILTLLVWAMVLAGCTPAASKASPTTIPATSPRLATETRLPAIETAQPGPIPSLISQTPTAQDTQPGPTSSVSLNETSTGQGGASDQEPTQTPTLGADAWMEMPVIPHVSDTARRIYQRGLELGNNPQAFSKVGDCQNVEAFFLAVFDQSEKYYRLGSEYAYLQETIDWFAGSWERDSKAVRGGYNAAALLSPLRADPKVCQKGENPLACELRLQRPSFALISLETWWSKKPAETYEKYLRQVIEYTIDQGVVPILATKADNLEGGNAINAVVGRLAYEYDIPLWNFWKAVQPLPNHGLMGDRFHLTFAGNFFDDPVKMKSAWPVRNLTALQVLDAVRRGVTAQPTATPTPEPAATTRAATASPTLVSKAPTATTAPTPGGEAWQSSPVIPTVSQAARDIYQRGLELGNNPQAFSKVGDCGSTPAWFLGDFDAPPKYYNLGEYSDLNGVIEYFHGSFGRTSLAAKQGFNASSVFSPLWSNRKVCKANENPLACEYRDNRPILAFIMLGTNDVYHKDSFEPQMRRIIEYSIERGIVPVLSTKADNLEKDGSINATIWKLAQEYQIPLWNYWLAVQGLPDKGLQDDQAHITWGPNQFNDPEVMQRGWPVRNLTALQVLDALWKGLAQSQP